MYYKFSKQVKYVFLKLCKWVTYKSVGGVNMITFEHVDKVYQDGTEAVNDFSVHIKQGEIFTLIGPSGCGKTTTMKMINRLITPTKGTIKINDKDITSYDIHQLRWNIGYVLQQIALFPHMTVRENIEIVPQMKNWEKSRTTSRITELLDMVGLEPEKFINRMPSELSGGQQQRIGVVRALAADPDIILMDEPFSALDPISREQLQKDIQELQQKIHKTIVFVTHDMDEALTISDRICLMDEGKIIQVGTPQEIILYPQTDLVKSFIGEKRSAWQMTVKDVLQQRLDKQETMNNNSEKVSIQADQFLIEAVKMLETEGVNQLIVLKDNQALGVIHERDILQFLRERITSKNGVIQ